MEAHAGVGGGIPNTKDLRLAGPPGGHTVPGVRMKLSEWRAARNAQSLARLNKALPDIFPAPVLTHALNRAFTPPMPRLAVDSYWRAHPVRADRLARVLAARSGAPAGWTWRLRSGRAKDLPATFRSPAAPYREKA